MLRGGRGTPPPPEKNSSYTSGRPGGFILSGRIIPDPRKTPGLGAERRESVGWPAPALFEQEGGRVQRIRPPILQHYPSGQALGDIYRRNREQGLRAAWLMSRLHAFDLLKFGINVDCLPVLDVPVEGSSSVIGNRAYGGDPKTVADMGRAAAEGLKAGGVLPVMKHIPGHGRGFADSHHELPVVTVSRDELEAHDFPPFIAMRDELAAMTCHVVFTAIDPDNPATTSSKVIDGVIRKRIGFKGLLLSDDTSMNALAGTISERAANIIAGGCDIVLHCNGHMDEMRQVVANTPVLAHAALERATAGLAGFPKVDQADEAAIRAEFDGMFATV
ncbi:glycoside hydrolase family 3 protein [Rhizobium sp. SEMIA 4085]|uniref:glycoside hydrolase family 3 N-terminal domain-containing protein n=1 Tax=Rhizobium sp. SEMIA 4085 TaxID=2137761 RepID=UPI001478D412|nr:glycoside hydrolase family 3 protein [Rhizobium sp. SEMIA 4085]NNH33057.1 glycoside hydrolase family 3 protein [Rhizobium sp. SEMIA 4085]